MASASVLRQVSYVTMHEAWGSNGASRRPKLPVSMRYWQCLEVPPWMKWSAATIDTITLLRMGTKERPNLLGRAIRDVRAGGQRIADCASCCPSPGLQFL